MGQYYVYIMTNRSDTLYTGVTNDLERRAYEHRQKLADGFTKRYNLGRLVYYEATDDVQSGYQAGETDQGLAARQESRFDRVHEPAVEGPERSLVHARHPRPFAALRVTIG